MTEKSNTRKIKSPTPELTKPEALAILATALDHCRKAGLSLNMGNIVGSFVVSFKGVELVDGKLIEQEPLPEIAERI